MSQSTDTSNDQEFQLQYRILGRMPSVYAHNVIIQALPEGIVLSFFETILPPKPEMTPEDLEQLKEVGILAECVARITLSPQSFLSAADALHRVATNIREGGKITKE